MSPNLKKIAWRIGIFGGVSSWILMNTVPLVISEKLRKSEHYNEAVKLLHDHPEAIKYLGEPIGEGRVVSVIEKNYGQDDEKSWIRVPIFGSKTKGELYYEFLNKKKEDDPIVLHRVELTLENVKGYKLLIKKPE